MFSRQFYINQYIKPETTMKNIMRITADGMLQDPDDATRSASNIAFIASPNCDERPEGTAITLLVIPGAEQE